MAKFYDSTNALEKKTFPKKKNGFKGEWDRTKLTMSVQKMKNTKPNFNDKLQRIVWGKPSN